jgi:hypothetical protein
MWILQSRNFIKTGISMGTLESNTGITEDIMAKFIVTFPEININWLITGEGDMLKPAKANENTRSECANCQKLQAENSELKSQLVQCQQECLILKDELLTLYRPQQKRRNAG